MTGAISQMQMAYVPDEDRILYRINSTAKQEFRFWITRRYAMLMLKVLRDQLDVDPDVSGQVSPQDKSLVQDFKKEKAMEEANFTKQFNDDAADFPLGEDARLAFKLSYKIRENGNLNVTVEPKEGQGINVVINQQLNITLTELLLNAARKGDWKLDEWLKQVATQKPEQRIVN